jgi:hypothetical protein
MTVRYLPDRSSVAGWIEGKATQALTRERWPAFESGPAPRNVLHIVCQ